MLKSRVFNISVYDIDSDRNASFEMRGWSTSCDLPLPRYRFFPPLLVLAKNHISKLKKEIKNYFWFWLVQHTSNESQRSPCQRISFFSPVQPTPTSSPNNNKDIPIPRRLSLANFPQSNGRAELAMKTYKRRSTEKFQCFPASKISILRLRLFQSSSKDHLILRNIRCILY